MIDGWCLYSKQTNIHIIIRVFIRYVLPVVALGYLAYAMFHLPDELLRHWVASLNVSTTEVSLFILIAILGMMNWLFEAVKWRLLASKLQPLSLKKSLTGILYGVSLGMITPRRLGEIAGRALVLMPENRLRGMVINTAGSLLQLGVTLVGGLLSVAYVLLRGSVVGNVPLYYPVVALGTLLLLLAVARPAISRLLRWSHLPQWARHIKVFLEINHKDMLTLLVLSILRYGIFMFQFFLLLGIFGVSLSLFSSTLLLSVIYLLLAAIPVSALGESGIRGSVALLAYDFVFGIYGAAPQGMEPGLVASILTLWFINLVLPASVGAALALGGRMHQVTANPVIPSTP